MKLYRPQWNENDKPTVRCPHIEGRRIGSPECVTCEYLSQVIDRKYETLIECAHNIINDSPQAIVMPACETLKGEV